MIDLDAVRERKREIAAEQKERGARQRVLDGAAAEERKARERVERRCFWTRPWGHLWSRIDDHEDECLCCGRRARRGYDLDADYGR